MSARASPHYTFEKLGEGITAAIARPEGYAICNSGLVDLEGAGVVFDTGLTPGSAKDLRTHAERILGRPPSVVVNSHRHLDHALGNSEFPSVPIWGTLRTREVILATQGETMSYLTREALEKDIRELEGRRPEMRSEKARWDLEFTLRIERGLLESVGTLKLIPPDKTFETKLALPGTRGAELVSFGSGHTEADALMVLPREKVVLAGDLVVVGVQPSMGSGDPDHWLTVLDKLEQLTAERIVPGHGPVTDAEGIRETRDYLSAVLAAAEASTGAPLPRAVRPWEGSPSLEENLKFARGWVADHHPRK